MFDYLVEHYPITQNPQPLTMDTFGCLIYEIANPPHLIDFRPGLDNGQFQLIGAAEPVLTFTLPASVTTGLNPTPRSAALCVFENQAMFLRRNSYSLDNNQTDLLVGSYVVAARLAGGVLVKDLQDPVAMSFDRKMVWLTYVLPSL